MLDSDTVTEDLQDTIAAEDGQDTVEAEAEEVVISIEGEEPEADPDAVPDEELGEAGKRALKAAREAAKESARKAREAEERAAAIEAQYKPKEPEIKRPTLEDCGFNEDVFAEKMAAFVTAEDKRKAAATEEQNRQKASTEAYQAKLAKYHEDRTKVGVDDDAQARVVAKLSPQQQAALMDASMDPAKVVAALAKTPKVLDELAGIKEIHRFAYRLAQVEGKITMTTKAPPPPESKLRGGLAMPSGNLSSQLEAAEKRAESTGDRTEVIRIRKAIREAGIKA